MSSIAHKTVVAGLLLCFLPLTGSVIDEESSLEIKRMMYMTDRRIQGEDPS